MALCASKELGWHQHSLPALTMLTTTQGTEVLGRSVRWQGVADGRRAVGEEMQSGRFNFSATASAGLHPAVLGRAEHGGGDTGSRGQHTTLVLLACAMTG